MGNSFNNIFKQINYREVVALFITIIGICFAILADNFIMKLIGVCCSFFAIVALINFVAQKITYSVKTNQFQIKTANHLKTTVIADGKAKRTTIDNFDDLKHNRSSSMVDFMGADEGFIIVNKAVANMVDEDKAKAKQNKVFTVDFESKEIENTFVKDNEEGFFSADEATKLPVQQEIIEKKYIEEQELDESEEDINESVSINKIMEIEENKQAQAITEATDYEKKLIIAKEHPAISVESEKFYSNISDVDEEIVVNNDAIAIDMIEEIQATAYTEPEISAVAGHIEIEEIKKDNVFDKDEKCKQQSVDIPISLIADDENELKNPMEEFGYIISRFLVIIRSVIEANTVSFVWVNYEKQILLFDAYLSDKKVKEAIKENTKIPFGSDILSQIVANSKPEILTEINPSAELDLIPYYDKSVGSSSFIGIPIVFENATVGILCADTDIKEAYDQSTVVFLGQFTRLLSALFGSYTQKFSSVNAVKTIELINQLTNMITERGCTFSNICSTLMDLLSQMYDCSSIGVCVYNEEYNEWLVSNYKSIDGIDENFLTTPVSLDASLVGMSISNCKPISIARMSDEYTRVNQHEPDIENGSFVAVPIKSTTDTFGALFIEAKGSSQLNNIELDLVEAVCNQAGEIYEKINLISLFANNSTIDRQTGILNNKALRERIEEELMRSQDTKQSLSLVLISLDKYSSLGDRNKRDKTINYLVDECRKHLKKYDIIGRVNDDVIGILNINKDANQSKLYIERIRHFIATQFVNIDSDKVVLTISAGIATSASTDTFNTFASNATAALQIAQKRTNFIQIYQ